MGFALAWTAEAAISTWVVLWLELMAESLRLRAYFPVLEAIFLTMASTSLRSLSLRLVA